MKYLRCAIVFVLSVLLVAPALAQTAPPGAPPDAIHYETIINPENAPPMGAQAGDLYVSFSNDGTVSGIYRVFRGNLYGRTFDVYGTRKGSSILLTINIDPVLTISGFFSDDRIEGSASNSRGSVTFRAVKAS